MRQASNDSIAALRQRVSRDSLYADSLKNAGVARYVELRGALPSTERPLLDSLMLTHSQERAAKDSIIGNQRLHIGLLADELVRADSAIAHYTTLLSLTVASRDGWKAKASKRDWIACGPGGGLTLKGAGLLAGCVLNLL